MKLAGYSLIIVFLCFCYELIIVKKIFNHPKPDQIGVGAINADKFQQLKISSVSAEENKLINDYKIRLDALEKSIEIIKNNPSELLNKNLHQDTNDFIDQKTLPKIKSITDIKSESQKLLKSSISDEEKQLLNEYKIRITEFENYFDSFNDKLSDFLLKIKVAGSLQLLFLLLAGCSLIFDSTSSKISERLNKLENEIFNKK